MDERVKPESIIPDAVEPTPEAVEVDEEESPVSEPTKLIRIASMTRAMLEEVREAALDEGGRKRLAAVHARTIEELRDVLSPTLLEEFDGIMIPLG